MAAKVITAEHVAEITGRIGQGEKPRKNTEISAKEFVMQMLPHVKNFLEQGFSYKEIAGFLGHVSASDLKKAIVKDTCEAQEKKATKQKDPVNAAPVRQSSKGDKGKKT
ncbi:MAG: hypothetical protein LBU06_11245 [Desulfovibrio sp.]|jgi:hypothetical protein|nr:hypothetical protein [Desulfovibrio sp.]